jgi:catechol 2,3-dioxygenase-like lactoylglutathione lyase family enzyme
VADLKRLAAAQGAWICFQDEAGQVLPPADSKTWARRGHTPVVEISGKGSGRVSIAGLVCPSNSRLVHRRFNALLSCQSGVYGLVMHSRLVAVTFEASDPVRAAQFWAALLSREVIKDAAGVLLPGEDGQLGLRFVPGRPGQQGANRMHLHLTSADLDEQEHSVAMALKLGGRHLDVGQRREDEHVVLADPAGYEFCVIEPGNTYLAGCGLLGELACDGTREVGLFWNKVLGWPLVWDQDEETAIQSPRGGTKIAWAGPPVTPKKEPNRQRFELIAAAGDQQAAADELISLGATRTEIGKDSAVVLADPDGNEFSVRETDHSTTGSPIVPQ